MSLPYTTLVLVGTGLDSKRTESALPRLPFAYYFTASTDGSSVTFFPETVLDVPNAGDFLAACLSASFLDSVVILAETDAEDTLRMRFFRGGSPVVEYVTEPGKATGIELPPSGADIDTLANLFGVTDAGHREEINTVMRAIRYDEDHGYGEAKERHGEIADLFGIPPGSVGVGYESIERGFVPDGIGAGSLVHQAVDTVGDVGFKLRQYVLFVAKTGETDGQIAARFLKDVIAWEDDILDDSPPTLGEKQSVRVHIRRLQADPIRVGWVVVPTAADESLEIDLGGFGDGGTLESINLFSLSKDVPLTTIGQLCDGMPWSVWSYETRRTIVRYAVSPG